MHDFDHRTQWEKWHQKLTLQWTGRSPASADAEPIPLADKDIAAI